MPNKNDPLTKEEMSGAASRFQELFDEVAERFPKASVEDCLKIMESCARLAHKERADKKDEEQALKFGFNKDKDKEDVDTDDTNS